jgi:hypothetical protein
MGYFRYEVQAIDLLFVSPASGGKHTILHAVISDNSSMLLNEVIIYRRKGTGSVQKYDL